MHAKLLDKTREKTFIEIKLKSAMLYNLYEISFPFDYFSLSKMNNF